MSEPLKLYTSSEKVAEIWRKQFPGIEIVMTPKQIPMKGKLLFQIQRRFKHKPKWWREHEDLL